MIHMIRSVSSMLMQAHLLVGAYDHGHSCDERQRLARKSKRSIASWDDADLSPMWKTLS